LIFYVDLADALLFSFLFFNLFLKINSHPKKDETAAEFLNISLIMSLSSLRFCSEKFEKVRIFVLIFQCQ